MFERERLIPLEQAKEYRLVWKAVRKVSAEGFVHYSKSRYSVSSEAVGKTVLIERDEQTIRIKNANLIIARHPVSVRKNADMINPEHQAQM